MHLSSVDLLLKRNRREEEQRFRENVIPFNPPPPPRLIRIQFHSNNIKGGFLFEHKSYKPWRNQWVRACVVLRVNFRTIKGVLSQLTSWQLTGARLRCTEALLFQNPLSRRCEPPLPSFFCLQLSSSLPLFTRVLAVGVAGWFGSQTRRWRHVWSQLFMKRNEWVT